MRARAVCSYRLTEHERNVCKKTTGSVANFSLTDVDFSSYKQVSYSFHEIQVRVAVVLDTNDEIENARGCSRSQNARAAPSQPKRIKQG